MKDFDVFNGDADGICALTQLRLAEPRDAVLVTGVKRDISLLQQVPAEEARRVTVLDVAMEKNRAALDRVLAAGAEVLYADHHFPGEVPEHPKLTALIDQAPEVCTSLLIDRHLQGRFRAWAVVGAFGDNLKQSALASAQELSLRDDELKLLEELGTYINYNGYGASEEDLYFPPAELFRLLSRFVDPLEFIHGEGREHFLRLEQGYHDDMAAAAKVQAEWASARAAVFILPNQAWARRVSGVYGNDLANRHPERAHAVLTEKAGGGYLVSVRAPLSNKQGAADLCRQFPTGGGRAAAAGINDLPATQLSSFIDKFQLAYG